MNGNLFRLRLGMAQPSSPRVSTLGCQAGAFIMLWQGGSDASIHRRMIGQDGMSLTEREGHIIG